MVDLGQVRVVRAVKIWNRADCCSERLQGFDIRIGNAAASYSTATACFTGGTAPMTSPHTVQVDCEGSGRYLYIGLPGSSAGLTLCEVEVYEGCNLCPELSSSPAGSDAVSDCTCNAGASGTDGGPCLPCAAGKYKSDTGSDACISCPANTNAPAGSDAESDCILNTCNAGLTSDGNGGCAACAAGTYKAGSGNEACTDCGAGKYSAASGATAESTCSACTADSDAPAGSDDASDCFCNAGFFGPDGGPCSQCTVGKYKSMKTSPSSLMSTPLSTSVSMSFLCYSHGELISCTDARKAGLIDGQASFSSYQSAPVGDLSSCTTNVYVELDLGESLWINRIVRWMYHGDVRQYCNQKASVSRTGMFSGEVPCMCILHLSLALSMYTLC